MKIKKIELASGQGISLSKNEGFSPISSVIPEKNIEQFFTSFRIIISNRFKKKSYFLYMRGFIKSNCHIDI